MNQHEPIQLYMNLHDLMWTLVNQCEMKYTSEPIWSIMNYSESTWINMNHCEPEIQKHISSQKTSLFQVSGSFPRFMLLGSCCGCKGWSDSLRFIDSSGSRMPSPEFPHPHVHFIQLAAISRSLLPVSATMTHSCRSSKAMWDCWIVTASHVTRHQWRPA